MDQNTIYRRLKSLSFVQVGGSIRKSLVDNTPIGWNLRAPSAIRKRAVIEMLKQFIESENIPLDVVDTYKDIPHFQVKIKQL